MIKEKYYHILNIITLIGVSLTLRVVYNPLRMSGNLYPDEAYYLVNSRDITNLFSSYLCFFRSASLITYYILYMLFGFSLDIFIWVNYVYGVLLVIVTYLIVFDVTKNILKSMISGIFIALSSFFIHASQSNLIDLPIAFWLVILAYSLYKTHYDRRFILPSIIFALICIFTKEIAFYAVPILFFINILFMKNNKARLSAILVLTLGVVITILLMNNYIVLRGYSDLLSIEMVTRFGYNLVNITTTNLYLLFNILSWTYEKYLVILTIISIIYLIIKYLSRNKTVNGQRIYFFESSILFFSILFYLAILYINPAKVSLNIGWRYLLPSIFGLLVVSAFLISDLIDLVRFKLNNKIFIINLNNKGHDFSHRNILKAALILLLLLLPVYYIFSEINFYNRYVNVTIYQYDSLRQASLALKDLKQSNESRILTPFIYQVSIWTDFKFEEYYSFPKNNVSLAILLNETLFDYIIVSDWWPYHPYDIIQEDYMLIYSVTDIAHRTTRVYKPA